MIKLSETLLFSIGTYDFRLRWRRRRLYRDSWASKVLSKCITCSTAIKSQVSRTLRRKCFISPTTLSLRFLISSPRACYLCVGVRKLAGRLICEAMYDSPKNQDFFSELMDFDSTYGRVTINRSLPLIIK